MSTDAILDDLERSNKVDLNFLTRMREGAISIFAEMERQCYVKGDAIGELREQVAYEGYQHDAFEQLSAENQDLKDKNESLRTQVDELRETVDALQSAQSNVCQHPKFEWSRC